MSELRLLDPFLRDPFDDTLRSLMRPWRMSAVDGAPRMRVDLSERDDHYLVKADIPGVRKEDIDVRIDGNVVTLSAQSKSEKEERDDGRVLVGSTLEFVGFERAVTAGAVRDLLGIPHGRLTLVFESFAYKHGVPLDADFVFDVLVLPNPYYQRELRPQTGRDTAVMDYLKGQPEAQRMIQHIEGFIRPWLTEFQHDQRSYLTVAIGCTGGQHRSVYVAEQLASVFSSQVVTLLRHRELAERGRT